MEIHTDAERIIAGALAACKPDAAVRKALEGRDFSGGRVVMTAIGKAAWEMAVSAAAILGDRLERGLVVTKYGHSRGVIPRCVVRECGHPTPDAASFAAGAEAMALASGLAAGDHMVFLVSGGGSALFEAPAVLPEELLSVTRQLLACGADIVEINTIRKRLSHVKGGRFAQLCAPAEVFSVVLSDVVGDRLDMIASGPACPDPTTCAQAMEIAEKYRLTLSPAGREALERETPKFLDNTETHITGSVHELCAAAGRICTALGYRTIFLTDQLCCEAKEAGSFLASIARAHQDTDQFLAFIAGGETVVHLTGTGRGGRNQELALSAAAGLRGTRDTLLLSLGSDGTDGPTDAAGGIVDSDTAERLEKQGISIYQTLQRNDAYSALAAVGGLVMTGPTGTNVNDVAVLLIRRPVHKL